MKQMPCASINYVVVGLMLTAVGIGAKASAESKPLTAAEVMSPQVIEPYLDHMADWQLANPSRRDLTTWVTAPFYHGLLAYHTVANKPHYVDAVLAWGVNEGILEQNEYEPIVRKAWQGLLTCVQKDGRLGYVQQIGDSPAQVSADDSTEYGTGAVLLAGAEVLRTVRNRIAGRAFNLTNSPHAPNGAWCWFQDERAIVDTRNPANPLLLVGTVSSGPNGHPESGDIDVLWRNLRTSEQGVFELANRLERDDHNGAAFYIRPDGRYLAMYSKHSSDKLTRWRVSSKPGDPTHWEAAQSLKSEGGNVCYNNIYCLPSDRAGQGRLYCFIRSHGLHPNVLVSTDHGLTWSRAGKLVEGGYTRYAADQDKIHVTITNGHPHNSDNSLYHGHVVDGQLYNSTGSLVDESIFDDQAVTPEKLTPIFEPGTEFNGVVFHRAWNTDVELDRQGNPVVVFTARANDDRQRHHFFYARFDGSRWHTNEIARAGGYLYEGQWDYTGLAAIDPDDVNTVVISTEINPSTDQSTSHYELYRGRTRNGGISWEWDAITAASSVDNLRPIIPAWNADQTLLLWMRGNYFTFRNWDTQIFGLVLED